MQFLDTYAKSIIIDGLLIRRSRLSGTILWSAFALLMLCGTLWFGLPRASGVDHLVLDVQGQLGEPIQDNSRHVQENISVATSTPGDLQTGINRTIFVELIHANTGGPEALLQLFLALKKAAEGSTWDVKALTQEPPRAFLQEYPEWTGNVISQDGEVSDGSIVIVPEMRRCADMRARFPKAERIFVWLLRGGDVSERSISEGCELISHTYYIARPQTGNPYWMPDNHEIKINLAEEYQLTPYVTPSLVREASAHTKMLRSGRIYTRNFATPKKDIVIFDDDTRLAAFPQAYDKVVRETLSRVPGAMFVMASGMSKDSLLQLMKDAKIVYDDCMVGSERVPMEAALFGTVVVTNLCNVGSRFADAPFPIRVAGSPDENLDQYTSDLAKAIANALQNYDNLLADYAPARLYYASLGPLSLVEESRIFLQRGLD